MLTLDQEQYLDNRIRELQSIIARKNEKIAELEAQLIIESATSNHIAALLMNADMQLEDRE